MQLLQQNIISAVCSKPINACALRVSAFKFYVWFNMCFINSCLNCFIYSFTHQSLLIICFYIQSLLHMTEYFRIDREGYGRSKPKMNVIERKKKKKTKKKKIEPSVKDDKNCISSQAKT